MGVGAVDVEDIVGVDKAGARSKEDVVEDLEDGAWAVAAGEVEDVVMAGGGAEDVALNEGIAAGGHAVEVRGLHAGNRRQNRIG